MINIDWFPHPLTVAADFYALADDVDIRSLREPLQRSIRQVAAPAFAENFSVGGRPSWTPLASSTEAQKKQGDQVLTRSGKLKRIASSVNLWTIDGSQGTATAENLQDADYGFFHQDGTDKMPARPWGVLSDKDQDKIAEVFGKWLDERLVVHGF